LARQLKSYMDSGGLVPEDLVIEVMVKGMKGKGGKLIVDGFPRNLNQGIIYENKFREMYLILLFDVQKEVLFDRMQKRGKLGLNVSCKYSPRTVEIRRQT
jgi:adenylate kinase